MATSTRSLSACPIFGNCSELKDNALPTYEDVIKCFLYKRCLLKEKCKKDPSAKEISVELAGEIEVIWSKASIPCITTTRIIQLILDYHQKYRNLLKQMKGRKNVTSYNERCKNFVEAGKKLFDICSCKYFNLKFCNCSKDRKVPSLEHYFLIDQRGENKMIIGANDKITTEKNTIKNAKKIRIDCYYNRMQTDVNKSVNTLEVITSEDSDELDTDISADDDDFCPPVKRKKIEAACKIKKKYKAILHLLKLAVVQGCLIVLLFLFAVLCLTIYHNHQLHL